MKSWDKLREEQLKLSATLQNNGMYRFMMLSNQIGHLSHAISYMECAKIDPERYGEPKDYRGELKKSLSDSMAMLIMLCFQFDIPLGEIMDLANENLCIFNKTRIPRDSSLNRS